MNVNNINKMKTLINKLFKWLGYVPRWYHTSLTKRLAIDSEIKKCGAGYYMELEPYSYVVKARTIKGEQIVKLFPFSMLDADSQAYARICAEELCEMLNEKPLRTKNIKPINEITIGEAHRLKETYEKEFTKIIDEFLTQRPYIKYIYIYDKSLHRGSIIERTFEKQNEINIHLNND